MLEAILHVCGYIALNNICCNTFSPTADMMFRINSTIYEDVETEEGETEDT